MGEDIVFLHKIVPGCADHSYGIQVAKLAGLPQDLLTRSKEIMTHLSTEENQHEFSQKTDMQPYAKEEAMQLEFFTPPPSPVLETLKKLNIMELTPIEALNTLYDLQKKLS
jgi:DNA mismatch repair protein MutS